MSGEHQAALVPEVAFEVYQDPLQKPTLKVYPVSTEEVNEKARQEVAESQERISRAKTFDTLIGGMTKLIEASSRLVDSNEKLIKFIYLVLIMQCFVMMVTLAIVIMIFVRGR